LRKLRSAREMERWKGGRWKAEGGGVEGAGWRGEGWKVGRTAATVTKGTPQALTRRRGRACSGYTHKNTMVIAMVVVAFISRVSERSG